jgi:hypothetical protein
MPLHLLTSQFLAKVTSQLVRVFQSNRSDDLASKARTRVTFPGHLLTLSPMNKYDSSDNTLSLASGASARNLTSSALVRALNGNDYHFRAGRALPVSTATPKMDDQHTRER